MLIRQGRCYSPSTTVPSIQDSECPDFLQPSALKMVAVSWAAGSISGGSPQGGSPSTSTAAADQPLPDQNGMAELRLSQSLQPEGEAAGQQWGLLGSGVNEVRARMLPELVAGMAEIFLINGDLNSSLYTSSKAMHSAILGLLQVCRNLNIVQADLRQIKSRGPRTM